GNGRHRQGWQWNDSWNRSSRLDFSIGKGAGAGRRDSVGTAEKLCAGFKDVMHPPHGPHALSKVGIEMAMEDGISNRLVPVAAAVVIDLQRVGHARTDHLAIEIASILVVGCMQPLVGMLVMDVSQECTRMQNTELNMIVQITVVDVGRIIGIENDFSLGSPQRRAWSSAG